MNDLTIKKELTGLDESKAKQIEAVFAPMVEMLKGFESQYEEVIALKQSESKSKKAKRLRLEIGKIRIQADKVRKEQKAEYLRAGNAIQGVYNILKFAVADKEEALKEIEEYYARIEEEKAKVKQAERVAELEVYGVDGTSIDLGSMEDAVWNNFLTGSKANFEAVQEAERKAEEQRAAEEEKARVYRERKDSLAVYARFGAFDNLSVNTSENEYKALLINMKDAEKEEQEKQAKVKAENERIRKEQEKVQKENDRLRKEQETRAAKEREAAQKKAAEEKAAKEAARKQQEAPDREKLNGWASALIAKIDDLDSDFAKAAVRQACEILNQAAVDSEMDGAA